MSSHEPFSLRAINGTYTLTLRVPMHDAETGEERTAIITLVKPWLWEMANGAAVHGVWVQWEGTEAMAGHSAQRAPAEEGGEG